MKAEVDGLDTNKLVNVTTSLNNLKIKADDLKLELKTIPADLTKLNDLVDNEVFKTTKFITLKTSK